MALELTPTTARHTQENNIEANIIFEIEDPAFPEVFGLVSTTRALRIDDWSFGDGTVIGGTIVDSNSRDWIQERGTTSNISQKVDTDKAGGSSSITTFSINLIDKKNNLTSIFSPGVRVPDILGLKATVYWAATGAAHPEDSVPVFRGIISDVTFGAASAMIIVDSPDTLKRQDLLVRYDSSVTSAIDDTVTTIPMDSVTGFVESFTSLTSYILMEDEVIEVGGISGTDFTSCIRGSLGTVAVAHDIDTEASSFYQLVEPSPVDLALKLMLSGLGSFGDTTLSRVNQINDSTFTQNGILITSETFEADSGLVVGDTVTITGAANAANNVTERPIAEFSNVPQGTVLRLEGLDMVNEAGSIAINFKSQYDTLSFGGAIDPFHVDVQRFLDIKNLLSLQQMPLDIYVKDTINLQSFLDEDVLFPAGMFALSRKGRISVSANLPPLVSLGTRSLNADNIKRPDKIKIKRSIKRFFYNNIVYLFNENVLDDRFLSSRVTLSNDSTNRIKVRNKSLTINARGIRNTPTNVNLLDVQARRLLDRYQYGAEEIRLDVNFKTGFPIEIGDSVTLEGASLKLSDSTLGTRDYAPRILEVFNKKYNLKKGSVTLTCIDSNFDSGVRYATVSPASFLDSGSTTTELRLKRSFNTGEFQSESLKWEDYTQQRIQVRSPDHTTFNEIVSITGIKASDPNVLEITALSSPPLEDYIIEAPNYDTTAENIDRFWKAQHAFPTSKVSVVSGIDSTSFTVSAPDAAKFIIGLKIRAHSPDFTDNSGDVEVISVVSTTITVADMGFTPTSTSLVDVEHFGDNGVGYRYF